MDQALQAVAQVPLADQVPVIVVATSVPEIVPEPVHPLMLVVLNGMGVEIEKEKEFPLRTPVPDRAPPATVAITSPFGAMVIST